MAGQRKPPGATPDTGDRETLAKIARLITVKDDDIPSAESPNSEDEEGLSPPDLSGEAVERMLEALPAGIAVVQRTGGVLTNTAFALAFGYKSRTALEKAGGLAAVLPADADTLTAGSAAGTAEPPQQMVLQARSRSGRSFSVPVAVHDISAPGDERTGRLLVLHPQFALHEEAPAETNPRKGKNRKKKKGGQQQTAEREQQVITSEFLAKVSHEIRTPLNSIIGFAEMMKEERMGALGNDRYRAYIRDIYESGLHALSLVNDLLDISKIQSGQFELNFAAVDVNEVVAESVHSMQPQARRQRVVMRISLAENLPSVLADRRSIKQILLNLVSNAIKFTNPGGQVIVSTMGTASGGVRISVRDTGVGMSQSEISLAMKPFQQLDTAPRKQIGTGLGLPLTKALVEANRARFKLKSASEAGTRIDVTFPASRVAHARDTAKD